MFQAKLKSDTLKELVGVVSSLVEEVKISLHKDSMSLKAVDTSHVAMIELTLSAKAFDSYKAAEKEIGVDLNKIKDVLKLASPGEQIEWTLNEEKNKMVFKLGNITRYMSLVDLSGMTDPRVPKLDLPAKIVVDLEEFRKGIRAAEAITDHIALIAASDGFRMEAEGDTERVELQLGKDHGVKEIKIKETVRSVFPLDYLSTMMKAVSASPIEVHMGQEYPVRIVFTMAEGAGEGAFLLAPRIEND
ncbi:MAG TPA: proliferating cell nuclear antigen (pcna) [Thermoplasmata archaeon]|nr:proliferating cell nuclear antigen (pcna) [Thermoplasmata archaeon]